MGKRIQKLALKNLASKVLNLGYVGENEHTQIIIDCSEVLWDYSEAVASVVVQPPRGDMYPVEVTRDGDNITWEIADSDLIYSGTGRVQITFTNDGEIVKSAIGNTKIEASIMATGPVPTPLENWMERAEETARQMGQDVADATLDDLAETKAECIAEIEQAGADTRATIPADYTQLSDDVTELKSAFEQLNDNVIVDSAGPSPIVSIADGADGMSMRKVEVAIEPVQDLHGYDSPWPAGGGKNKFPITLESQSKNGTTFTVANDGVITISNTPSELTRVSLNNLSITPNEAMRFSSMGIVTGLRIFCLKTVSGAASYPTISPETTLNTGETYSSFVLEVSTSFTGTATVKMQLETGSATTDWTPYSNVCPISGWTGAKVTRTGKNLLDPEKRTSYGSGKGQRWYEADGILLKANQPYTMSVESANSIFVYFIDKKTNATLKSGAKPQTYTPTEDVFAYVQAYGTEDITSIETFQLELGSTATAYEPYQGQTYEVTFPTEAGTVYGGTLDVVSGKLVVDRATVVLDGTEDWTWSSSNLLASTIVNGGVITNGVTQHNVYTQNSTFIDRSWALRQSVDGTLGMFYGQSWIYAKYSKITDAESAKAFFVNNPTTVVYKLAQSIEIDLTPTEVKTLLGANNIWSDVGNTAITYPADTKTYIDNRINSTRKLIAGIETGFVASKPYSVGDMLIIGDDLYKVASSIASGATITVGTNVTKTTVAEQLIALANA